MRKIFTLTFMLIGLAFALPMHAQESTPDSLELDTFVAPVGVKEINTEMGYLLYNVGTRTYLTDAGTMVSSQDSASVWQFSGTTGSVQVTSGDTYIVLSGSLLSLTFSIGATPGSVNVQHTDSLFRFTGKTTIGSARYLSVDPATLLPTNNTRTDSLSAWFLIEREAPEEEPTVGFRIISKNATSNRTEYVIAYPSIRPDGSEVELSGFLAVPTRNGAFNGDHFLMSSHYTMTKNTEVPSAAGPMENTVYSLSSAKPVMVAPDYLGYGITAGEDHPYIAPDIMARHCVDMLYAAHKLLDQKYHVDLDSLRLPTYGVGYSQGGSIALAIQKYIENSPELSDSLRTLINYSGTRCGAGPYDPLATLSQYIYQDSLSMPVAAPLLVIGLVSAHQDLMQGYTAADYFSDAFNAAGLIDSIATRRYTTTELNNAIIEACGGGTMHVMLSDSALDLNSALMQPFMKTLGMSNLTRDWAPKTPVQFFHDTGDDVVPFLNTMSAYRSLFNVAEGGMNLSMTSSPQGHTEAAVSFMLPVLTGGYRSFSAADSITEYPVEIKEPGREGISFWWHSVELEATAGGSIYATGDWRLPLSEEEYGTNVLTNWVVAGHDGRSSCYAWAQPEEGYEFLGWYTSDSILLSTEQVEARLFSTSETSAWEDGIVNGTNYYPETPEQRIIAVFAPIPEEPVVEPEDPIVDPEDPVVDPEDPTIDPEDPTVDPEEPVVDPKEPTEEPSSLDMNPLYQSDGIRYDILGRRISTSANGQIYILNGKKYIQQ